MELFILLAGLYMAYLIFVIITILMTISRGEKKCRNLFSEWLLIFSEIVFTIAGPIIGFLRFDKFQPDIPFSKQHLPVLLLVVLTSSTSFWLARFTHKTSNLIVRILCSIGLIQGILLCFITTIHFIPFMPLGIIYPWLGFELLSPLIALLFLIREIYFYNKVTIDFSEQLPYRNELGFIPLSYQLFKLPLFKRFVIYIIPAFALLLIQVLIAYGCGQDIDALVKVFTHSQGFIFSNN